jgi:hypothetical protein
MITSPTARYTLGAVENGVNDEFVAGTAAQVPVQAVPHVRLADPVAMGGDEGQGCQDHPRCAKPTLHTVVVGEGFLHRVKRPARTGNPFDSDDIGVMELTCEHGARLGRLPVDQHGASAALAGVAPNVSSGKALILAKMVDEQAPGLDDGVHWGAI